MNPLRRLRRLFRRQQTEAEMAEEMRFHLEQRRADYVADGLSPDEAQFAAQRKFGNTAALQERARDTFGWSSAERFWKDLVFAARQLVRSPGFSLLAILTLGLGIGANTAMFSIVNGIVLKPLPYANLPQLDRLWRATPNFREGNFSTGDFLELQRTGQRYGEFAGYFVRSFSLSDPGQPAEPAIAAVASTNLFSLLGVQPELGRAFHAEESTPGRDRVVLLSQRVWKNRYGGRSELVGQTIRIDGEPREVIGVLSAGFNDWRFLGGFDFFVPLALEPGIASDRQEQAVRVIGRRAAAIDPAKADTLLAEFGATAARAFPAENTGTSWWRVELQSAAAGSSGGATLSLLIALSAFVLLLACANLANLYLVRTLTRTREFAVRAALGASRLQLLRPLVAESLLLALAGGGVGLLFVDAFHQWARIRSTADNGEQVRFVLDGGVLAWSLGVSLFTAFAFGLAPALHAARVNLNETLKSGGRGATGGIGTQQFRRVLIVGQFAFALVLLAGAATFIRGLHDLHHRRGGWEAAALVTGSLALPEATYRDDASVRRFQALALDRLRALPGVESASLATYPPFFYWADIVRFTIEGHDRTHGGAEPAVRVNTVSDDYFTTVGTPLLSGRVFDRHDTASQPRRYLVSQATARTLFGAKDPIGQRIAPATAGPPAWGEVIGVVADIETVEPDRNNVPLQLYQPLAQEPRRHFDLLVRGRNLDPLALVPVVRQTLTELDPDLPVSGLRPAQTAIERSLYQQGVLRDMLGTFGVLGLALASLGIYGVLARTLAQRSGEFAIRLALGANARDIRHLIFTSGARLVAVGALLGLIGAVAVTQLLVSAYPGIRVNSPAILALTTLFLVAVALLACWLPTRRAAKIDAINALRTE